MGPVYIRSQKYSFCKCQDTNIRKPWLVAFDLEDYEECKVNSIFRLDWYGYGLFRICDSTK